MESVLNHECSSKTRQEFLATPELPYHFTDSGLNHVYLVGIRYYKCECGQLLADIPAVKQLLELIARDLVEKSEALAPEEIRFLRKRLRKKQTTLAKEIGLRPETLSRMESGDTRTNERTDKLIRLNYALQSEDSILLEQLRKVVQDMLTSWKYSYSPSKIVATVNDNEWEAELCPAA
jgi:DNA-binding transcriptional regulator YiaG